MMTLITGTPGAGKSLFAVSLILKAVAENEKLVKEGNEPRQIFADIDGLNVEGVLKSPDDWRDTPVGSIIFYDEAQQHDRFAAKRGSLSDDPIIKALEKHRHEGTDIYFITQSPRFIHNHIRELIGQHFHLHRPFGAKLASVYLWRHGIDSPNSKRNQAFAERTFTFSYPKRLFKYYKSAEMHTHKFTIPAKFFVVIIAMIGLSFFIYKQFFDVNTQRMLNPALAVGSKGDTTNTNDGTSPAVANGSTATNDNTVDSETNKTNYRTETIKYNPNQPFATDYSTYQYQAKQAPQLAGCMVFANDCTCYDQQGTSLKVSIADCKASIKQLPFNPFKDTQQAQQPYDPIKQMKILQQINNAKTPDQVLQALGSQQIASPVQGL